MFDSLSCCLPVLRNVNVQIRYGGDEVNWRTVSRRRKAEIYRRIQLLSERRPVKCLKHSMTKRSERYGGRTTVRWFQPRLGRYESYLERLQEYFIAYDVKSDTETAAKRRAILLTSIGSNTYRVLTDLSYPDAPNTKTFDQLATLLRSHYKPTRLKVAERYRFRSASQRPGNPLSILSES